jgi:hypothetical protein
MASIIAGCVIPNVFNKLTKKRPILLSPGCPERAFFLKKEFSGTISKLYGEVQPWRFAGPINFRNERKREYLGIVYKNRLV